MFDQDETKIRPPTLPLTVWLNQAITDFYFEHFVSKYLVPLGLSVAVTGREREPSRNTAVGGAENSAHLHGLAIDFQILRAGKRLPPAEEKKVFADTVAPHWPGFSKDEIADKNHIHVNLPRTVSISSGMLAVSVMGILGIGLFKKIFPAKVTRR